MKIKVAKCGFPYTPSTAPLLKGCRSPRWPSAEPPPPWDTSRILARWMPTVMELANATSHFTLATKQPAGNQHGSKAVAYVYFSLGENKVGEGHAGRTHASILYRNITVSLWLLIFTVLHHQGLSLVALNDVENESASPHAACWAEPELVSSGLQMKAENLQPPPRPKGAVTGCVLSPSTTACEKWLSRTTKSMYILYHVEGGKLQQGQEKLGLWRMFQQRWLMVLKETPTAVSNFFPISHKVTLPPLSFCFLEFFIFFLLPVFDLESRLVICVMTAKIKDLNTVWLGISSIAFDGSLAACGYMQHCSTEIYCPGFNSRIISIALNWMLALFTMLFKWYFVCQAWKKSRGNTDAVLLERVLNFVKMFNIY